MVHVKKGSMNYKYLLILIILFGAIFYCLFFYYEKREDDDIARILGIPEVSILSVDYSRENFTIQDYDVVEVYELSQNTIENFVTHSSFELYEQSYEHDSVHTWVKRNWTKTPIDSIKWTIEYEFAFAIRFDNKKRNELSSEICDVLASNHAYYAYYSLDGRIALYVLDVNNCKLYIVYFCL